MALGLPLATWGTIATIAGGTAAVGGAAYSVAAGESQSKQAKRARGKQESAQLQAQTLAEAEARKSDLANRAARRRQQDAGSLLGGDLVDPAKGPAGTLLTGQQIDEQKKLTLGRKSLLGG